MVAVAFDTLKLARRLRDDAHMSTEQAEGVADALAEAMSGAELATKPDVRELGQAMQAEFQAVRAENREVDHRSSARFDALGERIERRAAESNSQMIRWVLGVGVTGILTIIGSVWTIIHSLPGH